MPMTKFQAHEIVREPTHPGELMKEIVHEHLKLSTADAAARLGVTRQALHRVLSSAGALSPEMALRFSAFAGGSAEMFLRMQEAHYLWRVKRRIAKDLARIAAALRAAA
jgi:addiction module HigA family antidote